MLRMRHAIELNQEMINNFSKLHYGDIYNLGYIKKDRWQQILQITLGRHIQN